MQLNKSNVVLFLLAVFTPYTLLLPVIILCALLFDTKKSASNTILLISLSISFACINATRVPVSDLLSYYNRFKEADNQNFLDYINNGFGGVSREILFKAFTYILHYLCLGSFTLYIFIISFMMYYLLGKSVFAFCKKVNLSDNYHIIALFLVFFNPIYFSISSHLIRQMLATSCIMYILFMIDHQRIKKFILILASVSIHASSIISFAGLPISKSANSWRIAFYFICLAAITGVVYQFLSFNSISSSIYIFSRISDFEGLVESGTTRGDNFVYNATAYLTLALCLYVLFVRRIEPALTITILISSMISLMILVFSDLTLITYRMFYVLIPFSTLLFVYCLSRIPLHSSILCTSLLPLPIYHAVSLDSSVWLYAPSELIIILPPIFLLAIGG